MTLLTDINGFCNSCANSVICKYKQSISRAIESLNTIQDKLESSIDEIVNTNKSCLSVEQTNAGSPRQLIEVSCKYFVPDLAPVDE